ncbi:Flagellar biosynthesis protein FlhA [Sphingomonas antarctica]
MNNVVNKSVWAEAARGGVLPLAILMLVMLMIVPVPTFMLDMGFVANIMLSLVILMISLNSARALDFSAFPTVLLFATLFRLSLNVASTRIVLVNGQKGGAAAGHVIEAFGQFLIGGNYVVGIFVFAVLMIINIVVITKGAGRVSEVSARFTLDALPGKQMAVDADLNAGLITPDEAKARRQEVSTEADFFGSMDGASKFVKGDAVAGILILFVNILGGLVLGVVSHNMAIGDAAKTYLTLAIGDALVAQVPALLLSIAAAAIVTRVSSPLDLSGQITSQFGVAKAWYPVAGILAFLGVLPGMPHLLLFGGAGVATWIARRVSKPKAVPLVEATEIKAPELDWSDVSESSPIVLEVGYALIDLIDDRKGAPLMGRITSLRRQLSRELGFVLPMVKVKDNLALPGNAYRLTIAGIVGGEDDVYPNDLLALDAGDCLPGVTGREVRDPTFGLPALWIDASQRTDAIVAGYTVVDAPTVIATHLNEILNRAAAALFGLEEAQALVEGLKTHAPQLVGALTPQPYSLGAITALCRGLLAERVPLKDFRRIADAMVEVAPMVLPAPALLEAVRQRIGGLIVQPLAPIKMPIPVVTFSGELEELLSKSARAAPEALWPFEPQLAEGVMAALEAAVQPEMAAARNFAVVTSPNCRAPLARLMATRLPDVPVLSFSELPEHRRVDVLHVVGGSLPALAAPDTASGELA